MTEKEYRAHPAISRSELWYIRESPEKFKWYKENQSEPTPALVFGQFLHALVLEQENIWDQFVKQPLIDKRTKQGKEEYAAFLKTVGDKTPVPLDVLALAVNMSNAIEANSLAKKLLSGKTEVPLFWTDEMTGEPCKCRLDSLLRRKDKLIVVDLKSTDDASTEAFMRSSLKYGYDFQAAMYSEGVKANYGITPTFVFVAIEKKEPYAINIFQADELMLRRGYDLFREYIGLYHHCKETDNWFGYMGETQTINNLSLPAWLAKEFE